MFYLLILLPFYTAQHYSYCQWGGDEVTLNVMPASGMFSMDRAPSSGRYGLRLHRSATVDNQIWACTAALVFMVLRL